MGWTIFFTAVASVLLVVLAMNFATPEKKIERRIAHRHTVDDPQFLREMSVMLGPAVMPGNRITALQNGVEIFPAMLEAIRGARVSITFETYIYWSGEIGTEFAEALAARARAGIPVNVTIDWVGSVKMDEELLDLMEEAGVRVHRYRPLHWYNLGRMNNRTHRKLLVVDGRVGFTGGVGVADIWQGNAGNPDSWRDTHYRIEGPVVAQVQAAFNDNWIKTTGEVLNGIDYFPALEPVGDMNAHMFIASPAGGSESMHLMYLLAIAASEHTIDLAASYFVPDPLIIQTMVEARRRNVRVRILVPGPHLDSESVKLSSKADWGTLLAAGMEIHVYQTTMLHTKLLIIDQEFVSVGSTNFDPRSFRVNDEASLNIYGKEFAGQVAKVFEDDLGDADPYTLEMWKDRPWKEKVAERVLWPIRSQL
ncbi:MAG: phospholipase D-like domain-containing protein [Pseudomonadota bacterium]|nr:phospholipase D-like domain-containing protein [Pseudomonadota bacterium]